MPNDHDIKKFLRDEARNAKPSDVLMARLSREIDREKNRAHNIHIPLRRNMLKWAAVLVVALGATLFLRWGPGSGSDAVSAWTCADVEPLTPAAAEYPLVRGARVFAARRDDNGMHPVALDRETGHVLWQSPLVMSREAFCADRGSVYFWASADAASDTLMALNAVTGLERWRYRRMATPGQRPSAPVSAGGYVCWSDGPVLTVLDRNTGEVAWERTLGTDDALALPIIDGERLYAASRNALYVLELTSGDLTHRHEFEMSASRYRRPLLAADPDRLVVARRMMNGQTQIDLFDPEGRALRWRRMLEGSVSGILVKDRVYAKADRLYALDADSGETLWNAEAKGCSPVSIRGSRLFLVDTRTRESIHALDTETGRTLRTISLTGSCSGLVVSDCRGYISGRDGRLRAVRLCALKESS